MELESATKNQYFSTSLEKGLRILSLFNPETRSLTQTEISRTLGINMTSTYRFVNTLVTLEYLEKDAKTKALRLGIGSVTLSTRIMQSSDEFGLIKSTVDKVHGENNITIDVSFVLDDKIVSAYYLEAKETLNYRLPSVAKNALHNTSIGKAYLSAVPDDRLKRIIDEIPLTTKTDKTIANKDDLLAEIGKTRERGYAMCVEEYLPGLISIGAPLINPRNGRCVGGVSFDFSIIQKSAQEVEDRYAAMIVELGKSLSEVLQREDNES